MELPRDRIISNNPDVFASDVVLGATVSFARFIDYLNPEQYWFNGSLFLSDDFKSEHLFQLTCRFLNNDEKLLVQGTYHRTPSIVFPFSLQFAEKSSRGSMVQLSTPHTGQLFGNFYCLTENIYHILVGGTEGTYVSCHLEFWKENGFRTFGAVENKETRFGFVATGVPNTERETLGNVVSISGGRRA